MGWGEPLRHPTCSRCRGRNLADVGDESLRLEMRRAGERLAMLLTRWATPDGDPEALAEAQAVLTAWDEVLGVPAGDRCSVLPATGRVTVRLHENVRDGK